MKIKSLPILSNLLTTEGRDSYHTNVNSSPIKKSKLKEYSND